MLGILLIYYVGRPFYYLADEKNKSKWLWAILGVLSYYLGQLVFGIAAFIVIDIYSLNVDLEDKGTELILNILGIPIGLLFAWFLYKILQRSWRYSSYHGDQDILDDNIINNDQ